MVLAGRTHLAEQRQFEVGAYASVEVLEAANSLASVQSREARALAAYEIALAPGTLLGADGVEWKCRNWLGPPPCDKKVQVANCLPESFCIQYAL